MVLTLIFTNKNGIFLNQTFLSFHYCIYNNIIMLINGLKSNKTKIFYFHDSSFPSYRHLTLALKPLQNKHFMRQGSHKCPSKYPFLMFFSFHYCIYRYKKMPSNPYKIQGNQDFCFRYIAISNCGYIPLSYQENLNIPCSP